MTWYRRQRIIRMERLTEIQQLFRPRRLGLQWGGRYFVPTTKLSAIYLFLEIDVVELLRRENAGPEFNADMYVDDVLDSEVCTPRNKNRELRDGTSSNF